MERMLCSSTALQAVGAVPVCVPVCGEACCASRGPLSCGALVMVACGIWSVFVPSTSQSDAV